MTKLIAAFLIALVLSWSCSDPFSAADVDDDPGEGTESSSSEGLAESQGSVTEGEAEVASGEAASGETVSGEAASGEAASGETASGEAASGETASGEVSEAGGEAHDPEGDAAQDEVQVPEVDTAAPEEKAEVVEARALDAYFLGLPTLPAVSVGTESTIDSVAVVAGSISVSRHVEIGREFTHLWSLTNLPLVPGTIVAGRELAFYKTLSIITLPRKGDRVIWIDRLGSDDASGQAQTYAILADMRAGIVADSVRHLVSSNMSTATPASYFVKVVECQTREQTSVELGLSLEALGAAFSAGFDREAGSDKHTYLIVIQQRYCTIHLDAAVSPSENVACSAEVASAAIGDEIPLEISSIDLGRVAMISLTTSSSSEIAEATISGTFTGLDLSGSFKINESRRAFFDNSTMEALIIGSSGAAASRVIGSAALEEFFEYIRAGGALSPTSPGSVIGYGLRYIGSGRTASVGYACSYGQVDDTPIALAGSRLDYERTAIERGGSEPILRVDSQWVADLACGRSPEVEDYLASRALVQAIASTNNDKVSDTMWVADEVNETSSGYSLVYRKSLWARLYQRTDAECEVDLDLYLCLGSGHDSVGHSRIIDRDDWKIAEIYF
jgi:hypothetical protein